jgi:hypothetical protein
MIPSSIGRQPAHPLQEQIEYRSENPAIAWFSGVIARRPAPLC